MAETSVREQFGEVISSAKRRVGLETPSAADSDGNVGIVRGALRAFGEGDVDGFLDALKDDVAWSAPDSSGFPGGGDLSGRDEVRERFVADVQRTYGTFGFRPESFLEADDENSVVVFGRFEGDALEGGRVETRGVQVWQFEGNAVARVDIVTDSAAFPEVITERKERERKEAEEKEKKEAEQKDAEASKEESSDDDSDRGEDFGDDSSEERSGSDSGDES